MASVLSAYLVLALVVSFKTSTKRSSIKPRFYLLNKADDNKYQLQDNSKNEKIYAFLVHF